MSHHVFRVALLPGGEVCTSSSSNHQTTRTTLLCRRWDMNHFPIKYRESGFQVVPISDGLWPPWAHIEHACIRVSSSSSSSVLNLVLLVCPQTEIWEEPLQNRQHLCSFPEDEDVDGGGILPLKSPWFRWGSWFRNKFWGEFFFHKLQFWQLINYSQWLYFLYSISTIHLVLHALLLLQIISYSPLFTERSELGVVFIQILIPLLFNSLSELSCRRNTLSILFWK